VPDIELRSCNLRHQQCSNLTMLRYDAPLVRDVVNRGWCSMSYSSMSTVLLKRASSHERNN
jgi:hypothetical protein